MAATRKKKAGKKTSKRAQGSPASALPAVPESFFPDLQKELEQSFARMFKGFSDLWSPWKWPGFDPLGKTEYSVQMRNPLGSVSVDFAEDEDHYELTADLPGMESNDIEVTVSGDVLTIQGEREEEKKEKKKGYHLHERQFGSFLRSFAIPVNADSAHVSASFSKGVLRIQIPKLKIGKKEQRKIEVKS